MTWITSMPSWLSSNLAFASTFIALVGLLLRFMQLRRTAPEPHLRIQSLGRGIVIEMIDDLPFELLDHDGQPLTNVYEVTLRFWNAGRRELRAFVPRRSAADFKIEFGLGTRFLGGTAIQCNKDMQFDVAIINDQCIHVDFDGFNPGEWALISLMFTGDRQAPIHVQGRVIGQSRPYDELFIEERARPVERASLLLVLVFVIGSLVSGFASGVWLVLHDSWSWSALLQPPESSVPALVRVGMVVGLLVLILPIVVWLERWISRTRHPKGFPIDTDYEAREIDNWQAALLTILTGKKHRISNSIHDFGKVVIPIKRP